MDIDAVSSVLREAAEVAIMPRFRALATREVMFKSAGEIVTVADREAEQLIAQRLRAIVDAPVVGEEATADDRRLDPATDGRLRLRRRSWIRRLAKLRPRSPGSGSAADRRSPRRRAYALPEHAAAGSGAGCGDAVRRTRARHVLRRHRLRAARRRGADFVLTWRTMPWDHAPGTLILAEAGGVARRVDGTGYAPTDDRYGLLNAADDRCWHVARALLLPTTVPP